MERKIRDEIIDMLQKVEKGMDYAQAANKAAMLEDCIAALRLLAASCQQELSAQRYEEAYVEIFAGLLQALSIGQQETIADQQLQEACQLAKEIMRYLEQMLREEKEVKKEIVFMPYKASMWDALESIWQAAVSDQEHCNAYVVPLPYCDRNPDGTVKEWHCETKLFPPAVPVVDYREYDLAAHHPDIIYIHNPYDDYNKATSVSCEYYSRELKKHTDLLVYVPYFVTGATIEPHFCQAPGIINADYVIVESEAIKEQYEKYYPGGNPPAGKFLALGSPKYDKVLSSRKEDFTLPKSWQELIKGRKIILYNTSVQAAMEHHGTVNQKLRYVFSQFRDRKDVVLWWRPHPLMKACLGSVTPDALPEYERIEQEYQKAGWGIFDDTPELHRAICYSDAYYGDASSVVQLYQKTEKPVMIENMETISKESFTNKNFLDYIAFEDFIADENDFWFLSGAEDGYTFLFKFHLKDGVMSYIDKLPEEGKTPISRIILKIHDRFVMLPWFGQYIVEFNPDNGAFQKTAVCHSNEFYNRNPLFCMGVAYEKYIFGISYGGVIIRYDVETRKVEYFTEFFEKLIKQGYIRDISQPFFWKNYCVKDKFLFLTIMQSNVILKFDMDKCIYQIISIGSTDNRYGDIVITDNVIWLLEYKKHYLLKVENGVIQTYSIYEDNQEDLFLMKMVRLGQVIVIVPHEDMKEHRIIMLNIRTGEKKILDLESRNKRQSLYGYRVVKNSDGHIYIVDAINNEIIQINKIGQIMQYAIKRGFKEGFIELQHWIQFKYNGKMLWKENYLQNGVVDLGKLIEKYSLTNYGGEINHYGNEIYMYLKK